LKELYEDIMKLIKEMGVKVTFNWIPREENREADKLSNIAMNENND
jgi:ribonuclease HI